MEKLSTERWILTQGDSLVDTIKSYQQVEAHREEVNRDTPRVVDREVYRYVDRHVNQVDQGCVEAKIWNRIYEVDRMVTEAGIEQWLPSQAGSTSQWDYLLEKIFYRASRSTARRLNNVQAHLNLLSITIFRECHMLGVDEWDENKRSTYMIDDHRWLQTILRAEVSIGAKSSGEALPPWWFRPRTMRRYEPRVRYWMPGWLPDEDGSGDKGELRSGTR